MLPVSLVLFTAFAYLALLFSIASRGERRKSNGPRPWRYSLALGVHCTTWAFYGTVTQAAHYGWWFAPTYAGGILVFLFAHQLMMKLLMVVKQQNLTSIADLIGSRYGKSHALSAGVALIALVALVPYISLQLRAITASFSAVTGIDSARIPWFTDVAAGVALAMIGFAILFGARRLSLSEKHPGLMDAVAFESVVKLVAFMIVGLFCVYQLFDGFNDLILQAAQHTVTQDMLSSPPEGIYIYLTHMLLGGLAMFLLPRQFQVNFIENTHPDELRTARWAFPLYLFAINLFILPIALAGGILVPEYAQTDMFLLALPVFAERPDISLIAFIGGLSAATSMVIVATLALSIMMSNDVITPLWLRMKQARQTVIQLTPRLVLTIRRLVMVFIIVLAYLYHEATQAGVTLVSNGLIAMALLAQLGPAMLGGLVWQRPSHTAAVSGILAGTFIWAYLLLLPSLSASSDLTDLTISHGVVISLSVNILLYLLVSWLKPARGIEYMHGQRYVFPEREQVDTTGTQQVTWGRLRSLLARFIDEKDTHQLDRRLGLTLAAAPADGLVPPGLLQRIERELAGAVGSAASRLILRGLAAQEQVTVDTMADWASEASRLYRFNRELLQASVENIPQGISVIDEDLRLVAWNSRYLEIFNYPEGFIRAGMPVIELLRYNAERGLFGQPDSDIQEEIEKRLRYLEAGSSYRYQRRQHDGQIIELQGSPMPEGGFVTTYTDITELVRAQEELHLINQELELRVRDRTLALTDANRQLEHAKQAAEHAHVSKSKFFAAAGHDLMQPFNAASLFCEMLHQRLQRANQEEDQQLARQLQQSLQSAEELLTMLLEMTKLESGNLKPELRPISLAEVLQPLAESFQFVARERNLKLTIRTPAVTVYTDKRLLSRVIQNLLSNAIRYTHQGRVLCGVRRRGPHHLELQVWDTGKGIPEDKQTDIFEEFHQLERNADQPGLGLGLAIVDRMCRLLDIPITLHSQVGKGTMFAIRLPVYAWSEQPRRQAAVATEPLSGWLTGVHVLLIDNDEPLRAALTSLFRDWGATVDSCHRVDDALQCAQQPDLLVVDYHLDDHEIGTDGIQQLRKHWGSNIPAILSTADPNESIREHVVESKAAFLPKPLKQAALRRTIKRLLQM
ncbi:response regulator [Aliidiomarina halalkaliphila]|uniref:histidine kinase n=1 Tax=Aliidiomarina halalkaliphila TaxID=2593535 RepID=A0A552WZQ6_9GAMM|nr:PAS domain-containing hybrid sensor histidine kinase/response regulator [Aliidiomarina halalkaliphila]TRW48287.1 response regulator [Aliidiomarina halalkaliphila]